MLVMVGALLLCGLYWWRLVDSQEELRGQTVAQVGTSAQLLADAVAGQTRIMVHLVDFAVQHLRDDYEENDRRAFAATVVTILKSFPPGAIAQVGVIDAEGYLAYSNLGMPKQRLFLGDREHFKAHVDGTRDRLFISKPVFGRVSKTWSIQLTRPILRGGRFAGIVVLSLAPEYISATLAIPDLASDDVLALINTEGMYLSRSSDMANALGKSVPAERPFVGAQAPTHGTVRAVAAFDKVPRTFAWRRLDGLPLTLVAGIGETAHLGPVEEAIGRERRRNAVGICLVLLLAAGIAALLLRISSRQRDLAASEQRYRTLFEAAGEGIMVTDAHNNIIAVNPAFSEITGYAAAEAIGRTPELLASGRHDAAFFQAMWQRLATDGSWEGEIANRRKDGAIFVEWMKITAIKDNDGRPCRYVALFSDITEKKRKEEIVWRQANYDALTGLPNRQLLEDRLGRAIAQANRRHSQVAVLFIDLDRFKPVNDTYGHAVGDELLHQVGRRLQNMLRDEDTIARLGGDEFVAVLSDLRASEAPERAAEKIVAALSEPYRVGEIYLDISCSIGVALYPRDADNAAALIDRADAAMYVAKESGRSTWRSSA